MIIKGRVWVYLDNVDTDVIIPARYLNTSNPIELAKHCMEDIDESFAKEVRKSDIIVAGHNFGSGSSREHAPIAIKESGVSCVIAKSFSRIFYRNAFNIGLPILESSVVDELEKFDEIEVDTEKGEIKVLKNGKVFKSSIIPDFMQKLIESGGLFNYAKEILNV